MTYLKPILAALMLALPLASTGVRAQEPPPAATEGAAKPRAEPPDKATVPPKRKPLKRRSVQQVIEPTPPIVTDGYRPTLVIRPPMTSPLPVSPPIRMNSCDGGGCTDTSGVRYNGPGPTVTGPQGQLCIKGLVNAQCF